jgi:hypothetical protein
MSPLEVDPQSMPLEELRSLRASLQRDDDAVSFVRRLTQAKIDLIRAEQRRRQRGIGGSITEELAIILGEHLTGGPARPPRPVDDFSHHPLAVELTALETRMHGGDVNSMDEDDLEAFATALEQFESQRSAERHELFAKIDELSAELVRRYREGEADVEGLLADD